MEHGRIVSAKTGGLVVGRTTDEDDIPMYQHVKGNVFAAVGLMQGGEYLMSKAASIAHRERIDQINAVKGKAPASFPISLTALCSVINTNLMPPWSGIWIDWGQYVVNRFATAQHFEELEELNADVPME
ncbi:hypothetical protein ASD80_05855 [Devosia sp. Root635]|nr:hypothetical protein ASD80_05855 [Devosia sp. Root635]